MPSVVDPVNSQGQFRPRGADVAWEDFDGEFVVLDLANGRYFSLIGGAATVWRGLMSGHSVEALCSMLAKDSPRRGEVRALVQSMVDYELLVPASSPIEPGDDASIEVANSEGPFRIDMFDDLADILLADPIHDVDPDTGWPVRLPPQD